MSKRPYAELNDLEKMHNMGYSNIEIIADTQWDIIFDHDYGNVPNVAKIRSIYPLEMKEGLLRAVEIQNSTNS